MSKGEFGGGDRPETNEEIANLAPEGTVPVAIYPAFQKQPSYPTKCVIYSQLTDFEDAELNDIGNEQFYQVQVFICTCATLSSFKHEVQSVAYKTMLRKF